MFRSKTLFVVGAGASKEVGVPIGTELAEKIARLLYFEIDSGRFENCNHQFFDNLRKSLGNNETNRHLEAARQISEGLYLASSIDNYMDIHQHDSKISLCGKTAIVHTILEAERNSSLYIDTMNPREKIDYKSLERTWYVQFVKILFEQVPLDKLDDLFSSISIVCFNYDRSIQKFLIGAISSLYSIPDEKAHKLVEGLKIFHPYGSVGNIPSYAPIGSFPATALGPIKGIEFGQSPNNMDIVNLSKSIKTYTEQIEDNELLKKIREEVKKAETIVFLGFGFHPQNMTLLTPTEQTGSKRVYATALGFSDSDKLVIENKILRALKKHSLNKDLNIEVRNDLTCAKLLREYRLTLAAN